MPRLPRLDGATSLCIILGLDWMGQASLPEVAPMMEQILGETPEAIGRNVVGTAPNATALSSPDQTGAAAPPIRSEKPRLSVTARNRRMLSVATNPRFTRRIQPEQTSYLSTCVDGLSPATGVSVEEDSPVEIEVLGDRSRSLRHGTQWVPGKLDVQPGHLLQQFTHALQQ